MTPACWMAIVAGAEKLDKAIAEFAVAYADQSTADYEVFTSAVKKGRLPIAKGVV